MRRFLTIALMEFFLLYVGSGLAASEVPVGDDKKNSYMERAEAFSSDSLGKFLHNLSPSVSWINGSSRYIYHTPHTAEGRQYCIIDTKTWKMHKMFDNCAFARSLNEISSTGGADSTDLRLPILRFDDKDPFIFEFSYKGEDFRYDIHKQHLQKILSEAESKSRGKKSAHRRKDWYRSYCSDSTFCISVINDTLWLYDEVKGDSTMLSSDNGPFRTWAISNSAKSSAVGRWIGNSHKRLMVREDKRSVGTLTLVNSLAEPRPTAKEYKFVMPGDTGTVRYEVAVADADSAAVYPVDLSRFKDYQLRLPRFSMFPHTDRYAYLIRVSRTCDTLDLCRIDMNDRSVKTLISEVCSPHYNEQLFSYHIINDGKEILWWSERSGKGRWYLYDGEGRLKNALTGEDFVSAHITRIDTVQRKIIFEGYGKEEGINPHYRFYYEASFDGKAPTKLLTPGNGHHSITFSPDGKYIVDSYSRMDMAPRHRIVDRKGKIRMEMEGCDLSPLLERGWKHPDVVRVTAADGKTDLYGVVYTPAEIEPGRKYPIISSVYPGPQTDLVPLEFYLDDNANHSLAQLGFVVINFAYRGSSPYRGRDFYTYGYGNLRDYPLEDDYTVIRSIAEKYPFADSTEVGIYGHSGGGFMTVAAMLARPDFYKVGVAASGNHDNNIYSQWWGESFHGGNFEGDCFHCRIPTNIENASDLKGRLLLITGDMDNNVHPANTFRLANALIKNNKRFDMMIIPGADHGLGDKYYINIIRYYFVEHLLDLPQEDIDIVNHK